MAPSCRSSWAETSSLSSGSWSDKPSRSTLDGCAGLDDLPPSRELRVAAEGGCAWWRSTSARLVDKLKRARTGLLAHRRGELAGDLLGALPHE